jgi:cystathionine beta-lyase/cystathionine gamma-synthase
MSDAHHIDTQLVHAGDPSPRIAGALQMPIFQSATYEYAGEASYHDVRYLRISNTPTQLAVHRKLATLEGGEAALATASGMAAISTTLLTVLKPGDHLLAQRGLYGGTHDLVTQEFARLGIGCDFIDADQPQSWEAQRRKNTRAIYVESLSNPLLEICDLPAVPRFARRHGLLSLIDNTFATPVNFRPLALGFDLVLHSATKYLNGHDDIVAGAVVGSAALVEAIRQRTTVLGGSLDPHAAFLLTRGLQTLALRVRCQNDSALQLAQFLAKQPQVARVYYPGLENHPHHLRAQELFRGGCGGVLSFELAGEDAATRAEKFAQRLKLITVAPSLGGVHSLLTRPVTTSHAALSPAQRAELGIGDGLLRLSVGIECSADLIADLRQGLA